MNKTQRILRTGSAAAGISALMLILMAFIELPARMSYPGLELLTGQLKLSGGDLNTYLNGIRLLFVLDGIFLCGWIVSWVGMAVLVYKRFPILGIITMIFGLAGAMFDFTENSIIWGVIQNLQAGLPTGHQWVTVWKAVQHMSYWLPFIGAVIASIGLWSAKKLDQVTVLVGTVLVAGAAAGLYFPAFTMASNVWFLLWFICSAVLLWRRAAEYSEDQIER